MRHQLWFYVIWNAVYLLLARHLEIIPGLGNLKWRIFLENEQVTLKVCLNSNKLLCSIALLLLIKKNGLENIFINFLISNKTLIGNKNKSERTSIIRKYTLWKIYAKLLFRMDSQWFILWLPVHDPTH